ncbi:unnamed protein product [Protopolystoma xenopodis]|uniref:Uncharacterized protein n=1 Tax=Protopolystoma xenopodis TaxID=117903 RepID=A0A448WG14_9PLAT|nr:unnamed protein product [Protopolystoma xenopodis]
MINWREKLTQRSAIRPIQQRIRLFPRSKSGAKGNATYISHHYEKCAAANRRTSVGSSQSDSENDASVGFGAPRSNHNGQAHRVVNRSRGQHGHPRRSHAKSRNFDPRHNAVRAKEKANSSQNGIDLSKIFTGLTGLMGFGGNEGSGTLDKMLGNKDLGSLMKMMVLLKTMGGIKNKGMFSLF